MKKYLTIQSAANYKIQFATSIFLFVAMTMTSTLTLASQNSDATSPTQENNSDCDAILNLAAGPVQYAWGQANKDVSVLGLDLGTSEHPLRFVEVGKEDTLVSIFPTKSEQLIQFEKENNLVQPDRFDILMFETTIDNYEAFMQFPLVQVLRAPDNDNKTWSEEYSVYLNYVSNGNSTVVNAADVSIATSPSATNESTIAFQRNPESVRLNIKHTGNLITEISFVMEVPSLGPEYSSKPQVFVRKP